MSAPTVGRCGPEHVEALVRLVEQVRADEYELPGTAQVIGSLRQALAAGRPFWVALDGDEVVGCVGLDRCGGDVGVLRAMFIAAEFRAGHGVGTALLRALLDEARAEGLAEVVLDSHPCFTAAHRFYRRAGFTPLEDGDRPAGYAPTVPGNVCFRIALPR